MNSEILDEKDIDRRHYKSISDICRGVLKFFDGLVTDREENRSLKPEDVTRLMNFGLFLMKNVYIVFCKCEDETQAYTMFELINDRGKKLDKTDLIKNFLLKKISEDRQDDFKEIWERFKDNLVYEENKKKADKVLKADDVIRSYLFASNGRKITISKLYEEFKKIAENWDEDKIIKFVTNLEKMTRYLSEIKNPKIITENRYQDIIMNVLDSKQSWPLIMLSESYGNDRYDEKQKLLELSFRLTYLGCVLNRSQGNFLESTIGEALNVVNNDGIIKPLTEEQFKHFSTSIINFVDEFFDKGTVSHVMQEETYTPDQMFKIITPIDVLICNHKYKSRDLDGVTVEHILPQSFENKKVDYGKYNFEDDKELAKCINQIGNATLLHVPDNSSLGDKELKDKKEDYKNSDFMITKLLVSEIEESSSKAKTKKTRENASKLLYVDEIANSELMTKDLIQKRNIKIYEAVKHLIYTDPKKLEAKLLVFYTFILVFTFTTLIK